MSRKWWSYFNNSFAYATKLVALKCGFWQKNVDFFELRFDFWAKFWFLGKILIFGQNFDFWPKFRFSDKISIFGVIFHFWPKFRFLSKILIFGQNINFWATFWFLAKIYIFGQNLYVRIWRTILKFDRNDWCYFPPVSHLVLFCHMVVPYYFVHLENLKNYNNHKKI